MFRIGVIGESGRVCQPTLDIAQRVGTEIACRGAVLLTGGTSGVMEAASRGAKMADGLVIGILPGDSTDSANEFVDIPITTGLGFDYRCMILVHSSDVLIMVGGGIGTLVELSTAYMLKKTVVVIEHSGGWASKIKNIAFDNLYLDHRRELYPAQIEFASNPKVAVDIALQSLPSNNRKLTNLDDFLRVD